MDALSSLLRVVRLQGAFFYGVEATEPWCIETVGTRQLTPKIIPGAEHLISYHVITDGKCYGGLVGEEPVELLPGDVIVFPQGDAHVMASMPGQRHGPSIQHSVPARYRETVHLGERDAPVITGLICGFLACDRRPFNPLLEALPRRLHLRGVSSAWLMGFTRQITAESRQGGAGSDTVLTRLAELMFIEVLRRYLDELPPEQTGWLAGLRDETVGRALTLLHDQPGHPWTLASLAGASATSRSNLARRFTELVGEPPMQYLARWRMQVASNLLVESGDKIAAIGREVGYDSEAAFSRAFKKATGQAPGAWREARRS